VVGAVIRKGLVEETARLFVRTESDSDWVLLPPVKVRQFVTLFVGHIVAGFPNALFVPQISFAALVGPR